MFETVLHPPSATKGVLLLHGGTGRGEHEAERRDRFATLGYAVYVPDLFEGGSDRAAIAALATNATELRRRVIAAHEVLKRRVEITYAVGHCFGGLAALELARAGADVRAVVSFHGGLGTSEPATTLKPKILAVCGAADPFCPPAHRTAFEAEMTAANADFQVLVLGGAKHGFTVPGIDREGCAYDAVADRRSWDAMLALFAET